MPFTNAKRIGDLLNSDPTGLDLVNLGDDEIRSLKSVIQNAFPGFYHLVVAQGVHSGGPDVDSYNITVTAPDIIFENFAVPLRVPKYFLLFTAASTNAGAVTVQINGRGYNPVTGPDGVALPAGTIKSGDKVFLWNDGTIWYLMGSNAKAFRTGDNYTGAHNFEGATITAPTAPSSNTGLQVANQTYVSTIVDAAKVLLNTRIDNISSLPSQTGHAGQVLGTDGFTTGWVPVAASSDPLPSQAGQAGKALFTNGTTPIWQSVPSEFPPFQAQTDRTILASTAGAHYWTSFTYVPMPPGVPDNQVYHLISQAGDITWTLNTGGTSLPNYSNFQDGLIAVLGATNQGPYWIPYTNLPDSPRDSQGAYILSKNYELTTFNGNISWEIRFTIPNQTNQAGKVLGTDGTNPQWVDKSPLPSSNAQTFGYLFNNGGVLSYANPLPSTTGHIGHYLTVDANSAPVFAALPSALPSQSGQSGRVLYTNGTTPVWQTVLQSLVPGANGTVLSTVSGTAQWVLPASPYPTIPGNTGKFLSNDGTNAVWITIPTELPSYTGNDGKIAGLVNGVVTWITPPSAGTTLPSTTGHAGHALQVDANSNYVLNPFPTELPSYTGNDGKIVGLVNGAVTWITPPATLPAYTSNDGRVLGLVNGALAWVLPPTAANELPDQTNANTLFLKSVSGVATWASPFPSFASQDGRVLGLVSGALAWVSLPIGLPAMTGQTGKFITNNGTNPFWTDIAQGDTLPQTANHAGHALQVDSNFAYVLAPFPKELPSYTGNDGKIAGLVNGAVTWITPPAAGTTLPSTTGHAGHALQVDSNLNYVLNPFPTELPSPTGQDGKVLSVASGAYTLATPPSSLPSIASNGSNEGFVLTAVSQTPTWLAVPKELPPQTGKAGSSLLTDGINASWGAPTGMQFIKCTATQAGTDQNRINLTTGTIPGFNPTTPGYAVQFASPFSGSTQFPPIFNTPMTISVNGSAAFPFTDFQGMNFNPAVLYQPMELFAYFNGTSFVLTSQAPVLAPDALTVRTNIVKVLATTALASGETAVSDRRKWVTPNSIFPIQDGWFGGRLGTNGADPRWEADVRMVRSFSYTLASGTEYTVLTERQDVVQSQEPYILLMLTNEANTGRVNLKVDTSDRSEVHSKDGITLPAGSFSANHYAQIYYNGIQFFLLNPSRPTAATVILPPIATMSVR